MKVVLLLFSILISSCSNIRFGSFSRTVDSDLEEYVARFEKEWDHKISFQVTKVHIDEVDKEGRTVGRCYYFPFARLVEIDADFFDYASEEEREMLIFHELGHCALNRGHDDSMVFFRGDIFPYPKSIMYPTIFMTWQMPKYKKERKYYMDELFGRLKTTSVKIEEMKHSVCKEPLNEYKNKLKR